MPNELELIALKTEFDLYLGFVKRLVLDLPDAEDRTRAALWLQKLRSINHPDQMKLRNEHLKLFLFALHRRALVGIFEKKPPKDELESFHDGLTLLEMTRELIEISEKQKTSGKKPGDDVCPVPPISTNLSHDLKEYTACQIIPKFGAHVYYAVSKDPIQLWTKSRDNVFPEKTSIPNQLEWELALSKLTDHILERQAEIDAALEAEKEKEIGLVFEDAPEEEKQDYKVNLEGLKVEKDSFKWQPSSSLTIYQNYDFSDVGIADDLEEQGKFQLELDEAAFSLLDDSLPGRQQIHVRSPYFDSLPPDISERRYHGVVEDIPEVESDVYCGALGEFEDKAESGTTPVSCRQFTKDVPERVSRSSGSGIQPLVNNRCSPMKSGGSIQAYPSTQPRISSKEMFESQQNCNTGNDTLKNYLRQYSSSYKNQQNVSWSNINYQLDPFPQYSSMQQNEPHQCSVQRPQISQQFGSNSFANSQVGYPSTNPCTCTQNKNRRSTQQYQR